MSINAPLGLDPDYTNGVNEDITVYKGPAVLHSPKGEIDGECHVFFSWRPFTCTRFEFQIPANTWLMNLTEHHELHVSDLKLCLAVQLTSSVIGSKGNAVAGILRNPVRMGLGTDLVRVTFHMANLRSMYGEIIQRGTRFTPGRIRLSNDNWDLIIDSVPEIVNAKGQKMLEELESEQGFAITHFGQLERKDKSVFTAAEADVVLDNLGRTMSFANSHGTYPILRSGYNSKNEKVWRCWSGFTVTEYIEHLNWFSGHYPSILQSVFDGWQRLVSDPKFDIIKAAFGLFLDSERKNITMNSRLVIAQSALEGLASGWPFAPLASVTSVPKYTGAAGKLTKIAVSLGLPLDVPPELKELTNLKYPNQNASSALKIVWVRNSIAHLNLYQRLAGLPSKVTYHAYKIAVWHLELALLRLLKADGVYTNRITAQWVGTVEKLPWL